MSAGMEDLLAKFQAEALLRCEEWMRETMAEALEDEGAAADTEDAQPCAKKVRSLEHRSPSPVPRTLCRVSSPDRDPPGAATGQCPASEALRPAKNPFSTVDDLLDVNNTVNNEDLHTSFATTFPSSFHSDCDMKSFKNMAYCEDEESSTSSDSSFEWVATAPDNEITCVEDLLAKFQAEALVRGLDWLQDTVAEILEDEGIAADTEDAQPCDKRIRPLEHRSPSPVPRTWCRVSSPDKDPPGAATGQCPASEGLHPGRNLFSSVSDLLDVNNTVNNEDLRTSFDTTFTRSFQSDCDMKSFKNMSDCEDEESSTSSDSSFEWAATAPDNDITSVEDLLVKFRAEALVRGLDWLQDTVAEILEDEGAAADTDDAQPCDKKVRPLEHRSPSPVSRTRCRVSSPDKDPPGVATGQCPASEGLHPGRNLFSSVSDLLDVNNTVNNEDSRTSFDTTFTRSFQSDCDMKSFKNMSDCKDEESSTSSDSSFKWAATAPDNDITSVEDLLVKFRAEALVRGLDWLQDTVAEILEDEGAAADTDDAQPCDKRIRPLEHRSPSPVPRTQCRVSSPDRDPSGAATGQCPASEGLHPEKNPFSSVSDLLDVNNMVNNEDLQTLFDTFTRNLHSDCNMRSRKNVAHCKYGESSTSSDGPFEWVATAADNDFTSVEDLLAKFRAEALVRGAQWLQDTVAEILEDEGATADTEDAQPCAKKVRPLEHRSPSPVPKTRCRLSSPDRDPPGAATGQCPASEGLHPNMNPFKLHSDLQHDVNEAHDEDLRILSDATLQRDADSGPGSAVTVTVSMADNESSVDHSEQDNFSQCADSRPDQLTAQLPNSSSGRVPLTSHAKRTVVVSDAVRIERLIQSCSAAASIRRQHAPKPLNLSAPGKASTTQTLFTTINATF